MSNPIFTIGHSNHPIQSFIGLLAKYQIKILADVRSSPASRMNPQFNRVSLEASCNRSHIGYWFLGDGLGGKPKNMDCYIDGQVQYNLIAQTPAFKRSLVELIEGADKYNIAIMCAEKDPLTCHRTIMVGRHLNLEGITTTHILANGQIETQQQAEDRLIDETRFPNFDPKMQREQLLEHAYVLRAQQMLRGLRKAG